MAKYISLDNAKRIQKLYQNIEIDNKNNIYNVVMKPEIVMGKENEERNNLQKYVVKDLLRTMIFVIFSLLVIFAVSVLSSDFSYAKSIRESLKITQLKL